MTDRPATVTTDELDVTALRPYLEAHVPGLKGPLEFSKFPGGQSNPTYRIFAASGNYVLRRQPPGKLLKSAHAVDREYRVMAALRETGVPVPQVHHLCEDPDIIGSMFFVMEFCDGRTFWDAAIPEMPRAERALVYEEMVSVLARLHSVDVQKSGLSDFGKAGNYFARQFDRWSRQYRVSELGKIDAMEALIGWLDSNIPADDGQIVLVHGDFRIDNMIFAADAPKVIALLDWELSTLGHPLADLGYFCMQLRMPQNIGGMSGLRGKDLAALGIPDETACVAAYCEHRGIEDVEELPFYIAFSFFRLAAIVQGVAKRAIDGNASSQQAAELGKFVEPIAALALEAIAET